MKEELSRKERKQPRLDEKNWIILRIATFTNNKEILWKKFEKGDGYYAVTKINGVEVAIKYFDWMWFKHMVISHNKACETIRRTRGSKSNFEYLLATIEDQIYKREEEEAQKEQPQDDTTKTLPIIPFEERKDTETFVAIKDSMELEKVIIFLKSKNI